MPEEFRYRGRNCAYPIFEKIMLAALFATYLAVVGATLIVMH